MGTATDAAAVALIAGVVVGVLVAWLLYPTRPTLADVLLELDARWRPLVRAYLEAKAEKPLSVVDDDEDEAPGSVWGPLEDEELEPGEEELKP